RALPFSPARPPLLHPSPRGVSRSLRASFGARSCRFAAMQFTPTVLHRRRLARLTGAPSGRATLPISQPSICADAVDTHRNELACDFGVGMDPCERALLRGLGERRLFAHRFSLS